MNLLLALKGLTILSTDLMVTFPPHLLVAPPGSSDHTCAGRSSHSDSWHSLGRLFAQLKKERNVLFNDALNTFYLRLYGVRHMVKDHSDSEKGNSLPPHRLLLSINSKGSFICTIPHRQDNTYHGLCYTSRGALAGTRNSSMGPPHEGSIRRPITPFGGKSLKTTGHRLHTCLLKQLVLNEI